MVRSDDFVQVSVRVRPLVNEEPCLQVINRDPAVVLTLERQQTFHFDKVFTDDYSQENVYNETVKPLVEHVKNGYNCTVFAYGQTGTGKTYTMGTSPNTLDENEMGLTSRALEEFLQPDFADNETEIFISFIEIYNEKVYDLLNKSKRVPLAVKGLRIEGVQIMKVASTYEAKCLLNFGGQHRHTGETKQNSFSSRSHAIFTIYCNVKTSSSETRAKLNLVDLAGSESVKKTGTKGSSFQEGVNINKGLLCIGQVMTALSESASYIPYRQSIITTILQDSLNKKNYVSLIACVKDTMEDSNETTQTLEFSHRVKRMRNKPEVNNIISQYKKEHPALFERSNVTPFKKKPSSSDGNTPFKTPSTLKMPRLGMSTILECHNSTAIDSPKSLFSLSAVSTISSTNEVQQSLSPMFRKYMAEMESSIIDKLQTVIRATVRRSNGTSRFVEKDDKENTPKYSWKEIQGEVSKIVQTEILQFTTQTSRATSSPLAEQATNTRRVLTYDDSPRSSSPALIPLENVEEDLPSCGSPEGFNVFKKPFTPQIKITKKRKLPPSDLEVAHKSPPKRRSVRISNMINKNDTISDSFTDFDLNTGLTLNRTRKSVRCKDCSKVQNPRDNVRKSVRLSMKADLITNTSSQKRTSKKTRLQEVKSLENSKDSPMTKRGKHVLQIINKGNVKDLQKLPTVGPKTAERIEMFRQVNGPIKDMSDLKNLPGWSKVSYKKFMDQNFLRIQD